MKIKIAFRPFKFIFYRKWYSLYRWKHPVYWERKTIQMIDIGMLVIIKES